MNGSLPSPPRSSAHRQKQHDLQLLAIRSLSTYASIANAFVIVAPAILHRETASLCDAATYNRRLWCRAENLCFSMRNGVRAIWLATESGVAQLDHTQLGEFVASNLHVMEGDATVEEDKKNLVLPILGLYAQIYAWSKERLPHLNQSERSSMSCKRRASLSGVQKAIEHRFMGAVLGYRHSTEQAFKHGMVAIEHKIEHAVHNTEHAVKHRMDAIEHRIEDAVHSTERAVKHGMEAIEHRIEDAVHHHKHAAPATKGALDEDSHAQVRRVRTQALSLVVGTRVVHHSHGTGVITETRTCPLSHSEETMVLFDSGVEHRYLNHSLHKLLPEKDKERLVIAANAFKQRMVSSSARLQQKPFRKGELDKAKIFATIQEAKHEIFPRTLRMKPGTGPGIELTEMTRMSTEKSDTLFDRLRTTRMAQSTQSLKNLAVRTTGMGRKQRRSNVITLFGPLVEMMEKLIDSDHELRRNLVLEVRPPAPRVLP